MQLLERTLSEIRPLHEETMKKTRAHVNAINIMTSCGEELQSLGRLEEMIVQYAGITKEECPKPPKKCIVLAAADHGIARRGISAYPIETTIQMTKSYLLTKGGNANAMANFCGADLVVVDVGIAGDLPDLPGLINKKIAYGTMDFTQGVAMSRKQAIQALEIGIEIAGELVREGYRCFSLGEMGIGNTASSAAIVAAFSGLPPEKVTGRGTGISDSRLKLKIKVVKEGLAVNRPNPKDALDVLAKLGGFETGALAGVILGAAANRAVVVIDGFNAGAAALIAFFLNSLSKSYIIPSHLSSEIGHVKILEILGMKPYIYMGLRLGEASGASLGIDILDMALKTMNDLYLSSVPPSLN